MPTYICSVVLFITLDWGMHADFMRAEEPAGNTRWTEEKAAQWSAELPWLVGYNFIPSTAINQLEMWQADTFDAKTIDRELGWAASIGCNTMRVFLHDICWREDRVGFFKRIDQYLKIADKHNIRTMFVIFDGVWDPDPQAGRNANPGREYITVDGSSRRGVTY